MPPVNNTTLCKGLGLHPLGTEGLLISEQVRVARCEGSSDFCSLGVWPGAEGRTWGQRALRRLLCHLREENTGPGTAVRTEGDRRVHGP